MTTQACPHCGSTLATTSNFCGRCGTALNEPGFYNGKHYTEYVAEVTRLMKEDNLEEAEKMLIGLVEANESEARKNRWSPAPWYYERLAVLYRKKKDTESEIKVLERYVDKSRGSRGRSNKILARLEKLKSQ